MSSLDSMYLKVASRVQKIEVFQKGWSFASCSCFASCTMKKHIIFLIAERKAFFALFSLWNYPLLQWAIWMTLGHFPDWTFPRHFEKDCVINRRLMMQTIVGADPPQQKRMYRLVNDRLQNFVQNYNVENNIEFLRGIAHNLALFA